MDEQAYLRRLKEASEFGDLDALADLIVDGAKGARLLPDAEVELFTKGIRKGGEKHDTYKHWTGVIIGALVIAVIALVA